jgi:hypothetical protein
MFDCTEAAIWLMEAGPAIARSVYSLLSSEFSFVNSHFLEVQQASKGIPFPIHDGHSDVDNHLTTFTITICQDLYE